MIEFYYYPTPNTWKISIALEEMGLAYQVRPVDITLGQQFEPAFLEISPNNRVPAIVDRDPADGGEPVSVFESGAILLYLSQKSGRFQPSDLRGRLKISEWLMWQKANLGPMLGQAYHFREYAPTPIPYAIDRYTDETNRLFGVLDRRLRGQDYICGDYSIVDMACWPWIRSHEALGQKLEAFPELFRWYERIGDRPTVQRGLALGHDTLEEYLEKANSDSVRSVLYGQRSDRVKP